MITLSSSTQFYLLRTSDLENFYSNRAYCPIHGSDHQRSLQITTNKQDENYGFAWCHNCHATVVLEDMNPEAAQRIRTKDEKEREEGKSGSIIQAPIRIRVPAKQKQKEQRQPSKDWHILRKYRSHMQRAITYDRPHAYLQQRGIPFDLAVEQGAMYLPSVAPQKQTADLAAIQKWYDHIIFPITSPSGEGFIGRNLQHWIPGMDEGEQRDILKAEKIAPYQKTNPAGYFRFKEVTDCHSDVVVVEGLFDALACMLVGITNVIGLVGVDCKANLFPRSVKSVKIALDNDVAGQEKSQVIRKNLLEYGIKATIIGCDDNAGKDWNERYRKAGKDGLLPLLDVLAMDEDGFCSTCGAVVEYYDDLGKPYCGQCWQAKVA